MTLDNKDRVLVLDPTLTTQIALVQVGHFPIALTFARGNRPPVADAGPNLALFTEEQRATVIAGSATDPEGDTLTYRWMEGDTELVSWRLGGANGECPLDLGTLPSFRSGEHVLRLEVSDGGAVSTDTMILTVNNSAPHPAPVGGGTYEIGAPVILGGQVADFDGDPVTYRWLEGERLLFSGEAQTVYGGDPITLPSHTLYGLGLGAHALTLQVDDGTNAPVSSTIVVTIVDTTVPTLVPLPDKTILWPPDHGVVDVVVAANASDNSGVPVVLTATVASNEPEDGLGDGDLGPDWTEPVIDQAAGIIALQFRAERSGSGNGRIYSVTITARDQSGNASAATVRITVPHDRRNR